MALRRNKRYRVSAPLSFSWESREGVIGAGEGHTRDISLAGVFILTTALIPDGSVVQMEINLPPLNAQGHRVRLRTQGRVVRMEDHGFAAMTNLGFRIDFHEVVGRTHGDAIARRDKDQEQMDPRCRVRVSRTVLSLYDFGL